MHNVQYGLNEQKCQDLAFFCHGRPYHASAASGVAETTHGCKKQELQHTLVWLESTISKYQQYCTPSFHWETRQQTTRQLPSGLDMVALAMPPLLLCVSSAATTQSHRHYQPCRCTISNTALQWNFYINQQPAEALLVKAELSNKRQRCHCFHFLLYLIIQFYNKILWPDWKEISFQSKHPSFLVLFK